MSSIVVHYTLTMPGKITNSTSENVNGDTAKWNISAGSQALIYAESEISTGLGTLALVAIGVGVLIVLGIVVGGVLYYRSRGAPTV